MPAAQAVHDAQLPALFVVLNVPLVQLPHVRFVVTEPAFITYCPAVHTVRATHTVAEF